MRVAIVDKTGELKVAERASLRRRLRFLLTRYAGGIQAVRLVIDHEPQGAGSGPTCRGIVTLR